MNRRSFIKRASGLLAAVAAPLFIPAERLDFGVPRTALAAPAPPTIRLPIEDWLPTEDWGEANPQKVFSRRVEIRSNGHPLLVTAPVEAGDSLVFGFPEAVRRAIQTEVRIQESDDGIHWRDVGMSGDTGVIVPPGEELISVAYIGAHFLRVTHTAPFGIAAVQVAGAPHGAN